MKKILCDKIKEHKEQYNLTYQDLMDITGLGKTQLRLILNCNGDEVSYEKLIKAVEYLGYTAYLTIP